MPTKNILIKRAINLLATGLLIFFVFSANAQVAVVHKQLEHTSISQDMLRAIFGMRLRIWPDGTPITVFVLNSNHINHINFCKNNLNIFPYQLQRNWNRLVYSGTGQAPTQVKSIIEMHKKISQTEGAVGYLPEDTLNNDVYPLSIR